MKVKSRFSLMVLISAIVLFSHPGIASAQTIKEIFVSNITSQNIGTLIAVEGGTFNNGSALMTVSSFWMSQYEITGEQYAVIMKTSDPSYFSKVENNPVEQLKWYSTLVFCNKLSMLENLTPVYTINGSTNPSSWGEIPTGKNNSWDAVTANWSANGYRLPTEAEWQFAAQGGIRNNNYRYAGSNTIDEVAWYSKNSEGSTRTVGGKTANELGIYDMNGNICEWCWDRYDPYPVSAQTDYRGSASGVNRVIRGGSWSYEASGCPPSVRHCNNPGGMNCNDGFRVVRY